MLSDFRFAIRSLLKTPGFTAVALLTLALGIGVNTSMFTVINTLLFQRLPFAEPDRLVRIFRTSPQSQRWPHAPANFFDLRGQTKSFTAVAAYNQVNANYAEPGQPAERLRGMEVTADFFPLLGINPELGRTFSAEDARPGSAPVVVISRACWMSRFGADPSIIGRQIRIDGAPATVIGVMPASFPPPLFWGPLELWRPMIFTAKEEQDRDHNYFSIAGRLAPGVRLEQAQAELTGIAARLARDYPLTNAGNGLRAVSLASANQPPSVRQLTWFVMALAGFVLLIACANLANLQFARTAGRSREYGIRIALGAQRWRIMRELITECLVLSLLGAALGLLVALWTNDVLGQRMAANDGAGLTLALDWRVFGFALGAAVLSGLAMSLLPAWSASRSDVNSALKQQSRGSTADRSHHRTRNTLIVAEVALALVLLAGASVFIRGLQRFTQRDPGWRTAGLISGFINLPASRYPDQAARDVFFQKLNAGLAANPAFAQSTVASSMPIYGYNSSTSVIAEGQPDPKPGSEPLSNLVYITPTFCDTLGIRLLQGRNFTADDRADTAHVALVNESLARAFWPGESPLGKRIGDPDPAARNWREVVGVISDVNAPGQLTPPDTRFQLYLPLTQESFRFVAVAVRGQGSPDLLGQEIRRTVAAIDPDQPVYALNPVPVEIERALGNFTLIGGLLGLFAGLGLSLAALGIYGVLAGFVTQRRAEIGVRMALGAQVSDVLALVLGRGLWLATIGAGVGLFGAFAVIRLLGRIMPELGSADPLVLAGVVVLLLAVALFACWIPARRATKVDPMVALRAE